MGMQNVAFNLVSKVPPKILLGGAMLATIIATGCTDSADPSVLADTVDNPLEALYNACAKDGAGAPDSIEINGKEIPIDQSKSTDESFMEAKGHWFSHLRR
ncbi:MAG: hypothetical protein KAI61_01625 [Alphaproteobacteria bacterium]|nr:hypothetical protein [Alphaproteobacteria bacterium]MCK5518090.1 hypothetical protein [Alphaproteobacteria bacterium]MCK5590360.1 hypothetical protein [Candidatus Paceibacterota bacterium]